MTTQNIFTGILSALMACTGGAIMVIKCADVAGLSRSELTSWLFIVYFMGGCLNLFLSLKFKMPIAGAHSITAVAFLSTVAANFSFHELAGGFIMAGALVTIFGLSGLFNRVLDFIPKQMIDALLAGIVLNYAVHIVPAFKESPMVGGMALLGFFAAPKISKFIPPIMGVLIFGMIGLLIGHDFPVLPKTQFALPQMMVPSFTLNGFISIAIPVAILILSNDIAVGLAALKKNGFHPPVNKTLVYSGLSTSFAGFFGGHAVNIGGMMTALCSSEEAGAKDKRVGAALVSSGLIALFGLFAWKVIVIVELLPSSFITLLSGFALIGVLLNSLQSAFSESSYRFSILFVFIITISNLSFLGVSSPVWSLLVGVVTAKILREGKYKKEDLNYSESQ